MKTKFKLNWPSLLLGAALCLAVIILVGSNSPAPQTISGVPTNQAEAKVLGPKTQATLNAVMEKLELMDQRILIVANQIEFMRKGTWEGFARVEGQLGRIEKK